METNNILRKFKLQKKYLAFFTVVPLLAATALIKVPCHTCHGEGIISSTGMDEVHVTRLTSTEVRIFLAGCDTYRVYQYEVTLTLENYADHDAGGYINLILIDYYASLKLDAQFITAVIPAHTSVEHTCFIYFMTRNSVDLPNRTDIQAEVLKSNIDCKACSGTGSIALNTWALSRNIKDALITGQRVDTPAVPPLWVAEHG